MPKILILIIGAMLIGAGAWYVLQSDSNDVASGTGTEQGQQSEEQEAMQELARDEASGIGSFLSLVQRGESVKCSYRGEEAGLTTEGTFYTDGTRFRVDALTSSPETEGTFESHFINDDLYTYVWGESAYGAMAMKMANTDAESSGPRGGYTGSDEDSGNIDLEQEVTYDCERWRVDAERFIPPSDIEFMDPSVMMENMMQQMSDGYSAQ